MKDQGLLNLQWSLALFEGLVSAGLEQVVLSPGSRSTPLVLAATLQPQLKWRTVLDERSAAFMALGMARAANRPVALVATSGSAPGNWLPAVMEASESGVPLVLLSANRPWELQQCGANQTTDQARLFGSHARSFHALSEPAEGEWQGRLRALGRQLVLESRWPDPGPVHLDFPFREPLVPRRLPEAPPPVEVAPAGLPLLQPAEGLAQRLLERVLAGPGILVCGHGVDDPPAVMALAEMLGAPLLADPLSDLRFSGRSSANLITGYSRFLQGDENLETLRPDWILQFGAMPVSAALQRALQAWRVASHWVVSPRGRRVDPLGLGAETLPLQSGPLCRALLAGLPTREEPAWLYRWRHREEAGAAVPPEGVLVRTLLERLPDQSLLFCGNSLAIRWLDAWSGSGDKRIAIRGNRGLSGIDGNLSTFLGMAGEWAGQGLRLALLGDLTFQHDLTALASAGDRDAVVVVLNNGGGGIFDTLPQRELPHYRACWRTPQSLDFSHLAGLFGVGFRRVAGVEGFDEALQGAAEAGGLQLLEVVLPGMQV